MYQFTVQVFNETESIQPYQKIKIEARYCFCANGTYIFSNTNLGGNSGVNGIHYYLIYLYRERQKSNY